MRLKHIDEYCDIRRGEFTGYTIAGRKLYRVEKHPGTPMMFVYSIGRHIVDVRDAANAYAPHAFEGVGYFDMDLSRVVRVLEIAAPEFSFPRSGVIRPEGF